MVIECRLPLENTPDAFDIFETNFNYDYDDNSWYEYQGQISLGMNILV